MSEEEKMYGLDIHFSGIPGDFPEVFSLAKYKGSAWWTILFSPPRVN
jgi:hypothetical protein